MVVWVCGVDHKGRVEGVAATRGMSEWLLLRVINVCQPSHACRVAASQMAVEWDTPAWCAVIGASLLIVGILNLCSVRAGRAGSAEGGR